MQLRRIISSLILIPVLLAGIFWEYGHWLTALVVLLLLVPSRDELYDLMKVEKRRLLMWWQNLFLLPFLIFCTANFYEPVQRTALIIICTFLFFWGSCLLTMRFTLHGSRDEFATHALTLIYLVIPLGCITYLRGLEQGSNYLFYLLAVPAFTDSFALYGGMLLGKRKMAPVISPNKTWEGAVSGTVFALGFVLLVAAVQDSFYGQTLWLEGNRGYTEIALLTLVISIIAQIGDLCESAMKRDLGIKDSGSTITGFGGYLDLMDSHLWVAPAMVIYVWLFVGV